MEKYTTTSLKEAVNLDKDIPQEVKDEENKKTIITNEAYAVCDFIERLIKKVEHARVSLM